MSDQFWMCTTEFGGKPKKRHATLEIATNEAHRLAGLGRGKTYVLAVVDVVEAPTPKAEVRPVAPPVAKPETVNKVKLEVVPVNQVVVNHATVTIIKAPIVTIKKSRVCHKH